MSDLTVVICSYKATKEFELCLHQLGFFGIKNDELLIYENSPEYYSENREMLNKYGIKYIDNPGGTHVDTMNRALKEVKTKYALLLDSDCFLFENPKVILDYVKEHKLQLYGDICGDRGGYHIHKRVHPWYCFVDVNFIKKYNIPFTDMERIKESGSESFVETQRLAEQRDPRGYYYDAGSSMFEDVVKNFGCVGDVGDMKPYVHKEGSSWYMEYGHQGFIQFGIQRDRWFANFRKQLWKSEDFIASIGK